MCLLTYTVGLWWTHHVGSEHASAVQSGETPEQSVFVPQYAHVLLPTISSH